MAEVDFVSQVTDEQVAYMRRTMDKVISTRVYDASKDWALREQQRIIKRLAKLFEAARLANLVGINEIVDQTGCDSTALVAFLGQSEGSGQISLGLLRKISLMVGLEDFLNIPKKCEEVTLAEFVKMSWGLRKATELMPIIQ